MPFGEYTGDQPHPWNWNERPSWHCGPGEQGRPEVLLRQVGPNLFQLVEGFKYTLPPHVEQPDGEPGSWDVPRNNLKASFDANNSTDLASVPPWLWWFIANHGRHSRAALLHDHIIDAPGVSDKTADLAFREALRESEVPILRRWLMWDAVSLATMWRSRWWWKFAVVGFAVNLIGFVAALAYAIYRSWEEIDDVLAWPFLQLWGLLEWVWSLGVVSGPVGWVWSRLDWFLPASLEGEPWWRTAVIGVVGLIAWRKRWLISLAGLALILLPTLAVFISYAGAWILELTLWLFRPLYVFGRRVFRQPPPGQQSRRPSFADPFRSQGGPIA